MSPLVEPGARLGPWVVKSVEEEKIRAVHETLGAEVTLKVDAEDAGSDKSRDEDKAHLARLVHPHVLVADEIGANEDHAWWVRWFDGPRLTERLDAPFDRAEVERVIRAIAGGLAHVRAQGIRDYLGAWDVFYERNGRVGFMGLAKKVREAKWDRLEGPGPVWTGSELEWSEPDRIARGFHADERADVYAIGAALHGMLALVPPIGTTPAASADEEVKRLRETERTAPSTKRAGVDPVLDKVCARAIERDPAKRFANLDELLAALGPAETTPLEKTLRAGEDVRFERHPTGWPPLTGRMVVFYGAFLLLFALPALGGVQLSLPIQKITIPVPVMVPALALLAVIELVRFAAFRSRLYVVTPARVLVMGGVLVTRLRGDIERKRIRGMQLIGTEPALALEERKVLLSGLDQADLDSIRAVLGDPPLLPPIKLKRRRRWRRPFALLLAVLFAVFAELEGWIQRAGIADFQRTSAKVGLAVVAAEAAICSMVAEETGETVRRRTGQSGNSNPFLEQTRFHSWITAEGKRGVVSVETRCERYRNLIPVKASVIVILDPMGPDNARFVEELRLELARQGIEATLPDPPK